MLLNHKYLRMRRTWIDTTSDVSRREGVLMYRPGRKYLQVIPKILAKCAMVPWPGNTSFSEILPGFDLEKALGIDVEYATIYIGNGSVRSKFTLLVHPKGVEKESLIVKAGNTEGASCAIAQEVEALRRLNGMGGRVPRLVGIGEQDCWCWSAQTVLPKGHSPNRLQKEHYEFLDELKKVGMSHGDFAPWNCSIVGGKLYVWDWEDAGAWEDGKDEAWFKGQVKKLLGIDA